MQNGVRGTELRQIQALYNVGTFAGMGDGPLLERFATLQGEVAELAFAALVARHGPMVWRVCRRVLRVEHDAHDAFQATWLVLVRKAGSLRDATSVGNWLSLEQKETKQSKNFKIRNLCACYFCAIFEVGIRSSRRVPDVHGRGQIRQQDPSRSEPHPRFTRSGR